MPGAGADKLLEEGKSLLENLESADANQEVKRLSELPGKVRAFQEKKGVLYMGLKVIGDAGQEVHAHDVPAGGPLQPGDPLQEGRAWQRPRRTAQSVKTGCPGRAQAFLPRAPSGYRNETGRPSTA